MSQSEDRRGPHNKVGVWEPLRHVLAIAAGTVVAVLLLVLFKLIGFPLPLDPSDVWRIFRDDVVNVELRDRLDQPMALGKLISIDLHNGAGKIYELRKGGPFFQCDAEIIHAGVVVQVDVEDHVYSESTTVSFDNDRKLLYVRLRVSKNELIEIINGERRPD